MFRTSALPRRGSLFKTKSVKQPQEQQQDEEEQERCPICFETLAKEPIGGRFLRSSSWARGSAKKTKVWCDCGHYFCEECLNLYVATSINEGKTSGGTLRCPIDKCVVPMQGQLIMTLTGTSILVLSLHVASTRTLSCAGVPSLVAMAWPTSHTVPRPLRRHRSICQ
jgi:hypothetical protein